MLVIISAGCDNRLCLPLKFTKIFTNPALMIATGFGIGFLPIAPGTWGSILGIVIFLLLFSFNLSLIVVSSIIIIIILLSFFATEKALKEFDEHDPDEIVIDEAIAMILLLICVPMTPVWIFSSFLLFRIFDILKPWPISVFDLKLQNSFGIMLDDILAAAFAGAILFIIKLLVI